MAARTSAGVGVGVTITLLGVVSLTLFILTIVFLSKYQGVQQQYDTLNSEVEEFVRKGERQQDEIARLKDLAKKDRKSLVGYLSESLGQSMQRVTGSSRDTFEELNKKMEGIPGATGSTLFAVIQARQARIDELQKQVEVADKARQQALLDLGNESGRVKKLDQAYQETLAAATKEIDRYKAEVDAYRAQVNETLRQAQVRVDKVTQEFESAKAVLNDRIANLQRENLVFTETIRKLQGEKKSDILRPRDEFALVDGGIIGLNPAQKQVFIGLGRKDKVILGMTFNVYSDASALRPDPVTGDYPRPKAVLEVTNISDDSSVARILTETKGNPVVKGDVIANPIYDPKKSYKFVVYGNFDTNNDGAPTEAEVADVKAMIEAWGGTIIDDLAGDVDFLVLGERPILPARPGPDTPIEVVQEYMRLDGKARRYDKLFEQAQTTSVPVLNEHRLRTLIGK